MTREDLVALLDGGVDAAPEFEGDGVLICHTPHVAPIAYLHRVYPRLGGEDVLAAEARLGRKLPDPFAAFLNQVGNGAQLFNISLHGFVDQLRRDPTNRLGQPISLEYGNMIGRPTGLADDTLSIGGMVGWSSQGELVMEASGAVLLVHPENGRDVAARWNSLDAMLHDQIARLYALHDRSGHSLASFTEMMHPAGQRWETEQEPKPTAH